MCKKNNYIVCFRARDAAALLLLRYRRYTYSLSPDVFLFLYIGILFYSFSFHPIEKKASFLCTFWRKRARVQRMEKMYLNILNKWFYFLGWSKAQSNHWATSLAPLSQAHAPTHPTLADILREEDGLVIGHSVGDSSINHELMASPSHWSTPAVTKPHTDWLLASWTHMTQNQITKAISLNCGVIQ